MSEREYRVHDNGSRVDPSTRDNEAIRLASAKGFVEVVKVLLADNRVDPAAKNNEEDFQR